MKRYGFDLVRENMEDVCLKLLYWRQELEEADRVGSQEFWHDFKQLVELRKDVRKARENLAKASTRLGRRIRDLRRRKTK